MRGGRVKWMCTRNWIQQTDCLETSRPKLLATDWRWLGIIASHDVKSAHVQFGAHVYSVAHMCVWRTCSPIRYAIVSAVTSSTEIMIGWNTGGYIRWSDYWLQLYCHYKIQIVLLVKESVTPPTNLINPSSNIFGFNGHVGSQYYLPFILWF